VIQRVQGRGVNIICGLPPRGTMEEGGGFGLEGVTFGEREDAPGPLRRLFMSRGKWNWSPGVFASWVAVIALMAYIFLNYWDWMMGLELWEMCGLVIVLSILFRVPLYGSFYLQSWADGVPFSLMSAEKKAQPLAVSLAKAALVPSEEE